MSLLWTRAMAWQNDNRHDYEEPEQSESFRDTRPYAERRKDYVQHIANVHGVHPDRADEVLSQVEHGLNQRQVFGHPTDYGFSQESRLHDEKPHILAAAKNPRTWDHAEEESVPTDDIRATQHFVRHSGIAHNLFHPGQKSPVFDELEGDPDYRPDWDADIHGEKEDDLEPHESHDTALPAFYRDEHGTHYCLDGHHRVGAEISLGKPTVQGKVISSDRDEDGTLRHSWEH